ncbi:MAG TPA: hypothetical protein PKA13_11605 [Geminicoccaceae bacterium]|nr:hypothetical protein [Geminicoccaceae bacterium]
MRSFADTRRLTLARRLASGMPAWAVAKGSNIPLEELEGLVVERGFAELVNSMAELMAMDGEARLAKLYRIAQQVLTAAILRSDERACEFMIRQTGLGRNPDRTLQRGLNATIEAEINKAERLKAEIEAGRLTPDTPPPEPPPPPFDFTTQPETLADAITACEAAAALPADRWIDPIDARLWRKAGALRREMLHEEVLHHAVAEHEAMERRKVPLELDEVEAIEAAQVAEHGRRQAKAGSKPAESQSSGLSLEDRKALDEIRAMYRRLPPERLVAMCNRPPRGMERLFAVLAEEIGLRPGQPQGP